MNYYRRNCNFCSGGKGHTCSICFGEGTYIIADDGIFKVESADKKVIKEYQKGKEPNMAKCKKEHFESSLQIAKLAIVRMHIYANNKETK